MLVVQSTWLRCMLVFDKSLRLGPVLIACCCGQNKDPFAARKEATFDFRMNFLGELKVYSLIE